MRTFIAIKIDISPDFRAFIDALHIRLRENRIKWIDPGNFHLTLFFLGETQESQVRSISNDLEKISRNAKQLELKLRGVGVFKNIRDPRVIWIGIDSNSILTELQVEIQKCAESHGFQKDTRPYKPHLTIGRPKKILQKIQLVEVTNEYQNTFFGKVIIEDIIFYQSLLRREGPEYRVIKKFPLVPAIPG